MLSYETLHVLLLSELWGAGDVSTVLQIGMMSRAPVCVKFVQRVCISGAGTFVKYVKMVLK